MAADSGAEIGFSASLLKNNFRPPVWKTPPPSTLEAEIVAGKDLKWPPSTLEAEIVAGKADQVAMTVAAGHDDWRAPPEDFAIFV